MACVLPLSYFNYPTVPSFSFALFSDEPEVFLPEYSLTAILHAAHFGRVVKHEDSCLLTCSPDVAMRAPHAGWVGGRTHLLMARHGPAECYSYIIRV